MKLDYLKDALDGLVRLYNFDVTDARFLRQTFQALADGTVDRVKLDAAESVDGSQVTFILSQRDKGVIETKPLHFEVALASEGWRQAADFVEPFCEVKTESQRYQWLTPQTRGIQLLLSSDGSW